MAARFRLAIGFLCLAAWAGLPASARAEEKAADGLPNFVVILADDMGYGDASCYGDPGYETPQLDRLAREGLRFTDFHSSGTVCSPTRAGLLTGRYQQRAGIPGVIYADPSQNRHHGLQPGEVTLAELLKARGYATGLFGKWHLGYERPFNPVRQGFDRFRGYVSGNVDYFAHCDRMGIADWWEGERLIEEDGYVTHLVTRHAIDFIEQNGERPFFCYVAHESVHSPYQGPDDGPVRAVGRGDIPGAGRRDIQQAYREMMLEMDSGIGQIVDSLERLGLADRTLVFFFSDNGANRNGSNGPLRGYKGSVWEGGHRVPAMARWPGRIAAGTVCDEPAISLDIMPTLLELAGAAPPDGHRLDGVSLAPVLFRKGPLPERTLFWEYSGRSAVRRGPWKLVLAERNADEAAQLFHLADDISEADDLGARHPHRVEMLQSALHDWKRDVSSGATRQPQQ